MDDAPAKAEKRQITMKDGRVVPFNQKQKLIKTSTITEDKISVQLDFDNGESRVFTMRDDMVDKFAAHGAEQKLGDEIAGEADIDDCVVAVDDLISRLNNGEWNVGRAASGGFSGVSILIKALVEATGKSLEDIKSWLAPKTQAEKLALRRADQLKPIIERLEAEKAKNSKAPAVDTSALLGELAGLGTAPQADPNDGQASKTSKPSKAA